jgi:hypothetical protein
MRPFTLHLCISRVCPLSICWMCRFFVPLNAVLIKYYCGMFTFLLEHTYTYPLCFTEEPCLIGSVKFFLIYSKIFIPYCKRLFILSSSSTLYSHFSLHMFFTFLFTYVYVAIIFCLNLMCVESIKFLFCSIISGHPKIMCLRVILKAYQS